MGNSTSRTYQANQQMSPCNWFTVRKKLAFLTGSIIGAISLFIFLFLPYRLEQQAISAIAAKAATVAEISTYSLGPALDFNNIDEVEEALRPALRLDDVSYAFVTSSEGESLFSFIKDNSSLLASTLYGLDGLTSDNKYYEVHRVIRSNGKQLGRLKMGFSLEHLKKDLNRSRVLIAILSLLVFFIGLALTLVISSLLTLPIQALVRATDLISKGDLTHRVPIKARDEIGKLSSSFNDMVANLDQANVDLRDSENRFRAVVEHTSDMLVVIDCHGIISFASPVCKAILGFSATTIIGNHCHTFLHPEDRRTAIRTVIRECTDPEKIITFEARVRHRNQSWRILSFRARNLTDHPGVSGVLVNARDVTETKEFEQELMLAKNKAEEMVDLKDAFLTNMSHEIRTPLTAILGFSEVLRSEVGFEYIELVDTIEQSGKRLLNTLNSVLDLAQLEAASVSFNMLVVNVYEEVRTSVQMLKPLTDKAGLSLEVCTDSDTCLAKVDRTYLNRILNNLVGNAIKFTHHGGILVRIVTTGPEIAIEVRDTGIGIDQEFMPSLFSEFKQESTGLGREYEGNGLGLTITKRLVEQMGGKITVQSIKGVGSSFTVSFSKVVPVKQDPVWTALPLKPTRSAPERPPEQRSISMCQVLAVDDNPNLRELLTRWSHPRFRISTASGCSEATECAAKRRFEVVLMDLNLEGDLDGIEVMKALREMDTLKNAKFVALTAHALPGAREQFIEAGFDDYLSKPFEAEHLFTLLESLTKHAIGNIRAS